MNRSHCILFPLICGVILLSGCGESSLPEAYSVGEDSLPALTTLVTLDPEPQCTVLTGEDGTSYQYTELEEPAQAVTEYRTALETEYDCVALSAEGTPLSEDQDLAPEGELVLTKESDTGTGTFLLALSWNESACTATPSVEEEAPQEENASTVPPSESTMTMQEVTKYFLSLPPARLELSGESLEGCDVFCENGLVLLDDSPCLCVNVYRSGVILGSYLFDPVSRDVYHLDRSTGTARLLPAG